MLGRRQAVKSIACIYRQLIWYNLILLYRKVLHKNLIRIPRHHRYISNEALRSLIKIPGETIATATPSLTIFFRNALWIRFSHSSRWNGLINTLEYKVGIVGERKIFSFIFTLFSHVRLPTLFGYQDDSVLKQHIL